MGNKYVAVVTVTAEVIIDDADFEDEARHRALELEGRVSVLDGEVLEISRISDDE